MHFLHVLPEFTFRSVETVAFFTSDWSYCGLCHVGSPPNLHFLHLQSFGRATAARRTRLGAARQLALSARRSLRFEPGACRCLGRDKTLRVNVEEDKIIFRMFS